uniref:Secreted protein n=1 Tax=Meloidogyne incognita TaxID=6306 RepID=A0A914LEM4_MELIC
MPWVDAGLLVVASSIACQFENLGSQVFKNSGHVDRSASADPFSIMSLAENSMKTSNRELKPGTRRSSFLLSSGLCFATFTTS